MAQAMRVEALSSSVLLDDEEDDDLWHVAVAPGEVKILSLDRLDDLFRLSIIDESTMVWQPGMKNWVPLGVIAGLDEEAESQPVASSVPTTPFAAPLPRPVSAPPPPRPVSAAPPNPFLAAPSAPPPRTVSAPPPRTVSAPPPRSVPAPMPLASTDSFGLVTSPQALPSVRPVAPVSVPPTLRPFTVAEAPLPIGREGGGASRWLIGAALLAGLAVTLYRNDVIRDAARSSGQEATYLKLEQALGGPSFGTPRAIEQISVASAPVEATTAVSPGTSPAATAPSAPSSVPTTNEPKAVSLDSLPTEKGDSSADKASTTSEKSSSGPSTATPAKRAASGSSKAEPAEPAPSGPLSLDDAIRRAAKGKGATAPAKKSGKAGSGFKGSGNEFDPLNGKLGK